MKFILFFFFIVTVFSDTKVTTYRCHEDGNSGTYEAALKSRGSLYLIRNETTTTVQYGGWHYEVSKDLGPFMIHAWGKNKQNENDDDQMLECQIATKRGSNIVKVTDKFILKGEGKSLSLAISCKGDGKEWNYKPNCKEIDDNIYHKPETAADNAKYLLDEEINTGFDPAFKAANLIYYAILDYPYVKDDCSSFLHERFENSKEAGPGYIIVSEKGEHCAIVDKGGENYFDIKKGKTIVQSNSIKEIEKDFGDKYFYKIYNKIKDSFSQLIKN